MAIGSMLRQPMKTSCLSSVGGSKMPKKVLTRVGKNKNIQLFYFFRSNNRFGFINLIPSTGNNKKKFPIFEEKINEYIE